MAMKSSMPVARLMQRSELVIRARKHQVHGSPEIPAVNALSGTGVESRRRNLVRCAANCPATLDLIMWQCLLVGDLLRDSGGFACRGSTMVFIAQTTPDVDLFAP
jgi:hypothetical protein